MTEAHRGTPVTAIVESGVTTFEITAFLHQPHAPWLTEVFIEVHVSTLAEGPVPARISARVPAHLVGEIGDMLRGLAAAGFAAQRQEIADYVAVRRLRRVNEGDRPTDLP